METHLPSPGTKAGTKWMQIFTFFNTSAAKKSLLDFSRIGLSPQQISWAGCPSSEASSVAKTAKWQYWYPGFGKVSIATGHKENLGVYMVQLIYAITAVFKSLRPREKPEKQDAVPHQRSFSTLCFIPPTVFKSQILC